MSVWEEQHVEDAVVDALNAAHLNNPHGHHFGRPYVTAYQLAMAVESSLTGTGFDLSLFRTSALDERRPAQERTES